MTVVSKAMSELFYELIQRKGSDLHLVADEPPSFRIDGKLVQFSKEPLSEQSLREMVTSMLDPMQQDRFEQERELDFSYGIPGLARFRGNILVASGKIGCVFRALTEVPPSLDQLGMQNLADLCKKNKGLVLVTGPTGSGKSTTLAAMISYLNENHNKHIITIEDPIEYVHTSKKSVIRQRELGSDTLSFPNALKHALRQDPDVIMMGEMRDLDTISLAVTAAETGHLVFGTLHTTGAAQTVDRIVDVFPPHQQQQIRIQVASSLEGVISQLLLLKIDGVGRACAMEIMRVNPAVRNLIREGKSQQILGVMQTGVSSGMQTMDMALRTLVQQKIVTYEEALSKSGNAEDFKRLMGQ